VTIRLEGYIDLPEHRGTGGFDHAAVHRGLRRLYVAHTANDALDVIDLDKSIHVESVDGLTGVAGVLVAEPWDLVIASNRGEDTVAICDARDPRSLVKVPVGVRPNGLAFDPVRRTLLVANVGDPLDQTKHTLSVVNTDRARLTVSIPVPGRTRWTVFDQTTDAFLVNVADPPSIVVVGARDPTHIVRTIDIPAAGPHGLDVDERGAVYCACDAGRLLVLEPRTYAVLAGLPLAGSPDVIVLDSALHLAYVAIGDPGVIEVFDVDRLERLESVATEPGAHTIAIDAGQHRVYAFLPTTHRVAVFQARS